MKQKAFNNLVIASTVALFALPLILDVLVNSWTEILPYFAPDAFYYLTVSRNFASEGYFTYDQQFPTNGFHPLWQVAEAMFYCIEDWIGLSKPGILFSTFMVNILAISAAIFLLARVFLFEMKRLPLIFMLLPVGVFAMLTFNVDTWTSSFWANANGMETSFVLLAYAGLMWVMAKPSFLDSWVSAALAGLLLGLLCLARLDHGFFAIPFFIVLALQSLVMKRWRALLLLVLSGLIMTGIVIAYLLFNHRSTGFLLPVSGVLKTSFPSTVNDKLPVVLNILHDPNYPLGEAILTRFVKLTLPVLPAALFLGWSAALLIRRSMTRLDAAFASTSGFIVLDAAYNYFYVPIFNQGQWYYPVSILFMSLVPVYIVGRWIERRSLSDRAGRWSLIGAASVAAFIIFYFGWVYRPWVHPGYTRLVTFMNEDVPGIKRYYADAKPKLIEIDDGIIAYMTDYPTMSGTGYTFDVEAVRSLWQGKGKLLELALARGFDRFASVEYFDAEGLNSDTPSEVIQDRLGQIWLMHPWMPQEAPFLFHVEYVSPDGHMAIIRVQRKAEAKTP